MSDDTTPLELPQSDEPSAGEDAGPSRSARSLLLVAFMVCLGLLAVIGAGFFGATPANASDHGSVRALAGEGCGGG